MTDFGDWVLKWNPTEPHRLWNVYGDAATLLAQLEEELDKRRNPGNPHLRESDHAGEGGCPQECLDFRAALTACKKFMEKYTNG